MNIEQVLQGPLHEQATASNFIQGIKLKQYECRDCAHTFYIPVMNYPELCPYCGHHILWHDGDIVRIATE